MAAVVCNLLGGPGVGKTSTAYALTGYLKKKSVLAEYVPEAIKWRIYRGTDMGGKIHQDLLMAEQFDMLLCLKDKVNVIVTDSPLLLQIAYHNEANSSPALTKRTLELFNEFDNFNVVLQRTHDYDGRHRYQTEEQADQKHQDVLNLLNEHHCPFIMVPTHFNVEEDIYLALTDHHAL